MQAQNAAFGGKHAVVLGANMAGLVAARVLSDHFARVTVIGRERLPGVDSAEPVRQAHTLLGRGEALLRNLFPGITAELEQLGAVPFDPASDVRWYQQGSWTGGQVSNIRAYSMSRTLLETQVRRRLEACGNVTVVDRALPGGFLVNLVNSHVTGVRVEGGARGRIPDRVEADLVVDARGAHSETLRGLELLSYDRPPASVASPAGWCATRLYRPRPRSDWQVLLQVARQSGSILPVEGNRWLVTLQGRSADERPDDAAGFLAFARSLPVPDLYEAIRQAEPLSAVTAETVPHRLLPHYERMARFPEGLVIFGGGPCQADAPPGEYLTTAVLAALELDGCLRQQARTPGQIDGLSRRFQRRMAAVAAAAWQSPGSTGSAGLRTWYFQRVHRAAARDAEVMKRFVNLFRVLTGH